MKRLLETIAILMIGLIMSIMLAYAFDRSPIYNRPVMAEEVINYGK